MHRTTIMISPDLKRKVADRARLEGISIGEFTRRALTTAVKQTGRASAQDDPLLSNHSTFKGKTPRDLAAKHDSYLYEGGSWGKAGTA